MNILHRIKNKIIERQQREREIEKQLPWWWITKLLLRILGVVFITAAIFWTYGQVSMCHAMDGYLPAEENTPVFIYLHCEEIPDRYQEQPTNYDVDLNLSVNKSNIYKSP